MEAGYQNTDCHFFMTSGCNKGATCPYRHSEGAKKTTSICTNWRTSFCTPTCSYRHPDKRFLGKVPPPSVGATAPALGERSKTPCTYFAQGHCKFGAQCQFLHEGVAPVSLHAQARLQEQQGQPAAPVEKKPQDNARAQAILSKFSAKARAPEGSVSVRSVPTAVVGSGGPVAGGKSTITGQGQGMLASTAASTPLSSSVQAAAKAPQPASRPGLSPQATTFQPAKRPAPTTSPAPSSGNVRAAPLNGSPQSLKSTSSSVDFTVPTFEEIMAAKKKARMAEGADKAATSKPAPAPTKPTAPTASNPPSAARPTPLPVKPAAPLTVQPAAPPTAPQSAMPPPLHIPPVSNLPASLKERPELPSFDDEEEEDDLADYQDLL